MASEHTALGPLGMNEQHVGLKRQGSATFSSGNIPRSHRSSSPTKRSATAVLESYQEIVGRGSEAEPDTSAQPQGSQGSEPCGLDFLLQACDILEPRAEAINPGTNAGGGLWGNQGVEQGQQATSRGRRSLRPGGEGEFDGTPFHSSEEDDDYKPAKRPNGRPARRAASARAAAVVAATSGGSAPSNLRWERGLVTGPCTNPDCEHPHDSPQWRKGPPQSPILCNACGTRWLRNGTLKPLVVRFFFFYCYYSADLFIINGVLSILILITHLFLFPSLFCSLVAVLDTAKLVPRAASRPPPMLASPPPPPVPLARGPGRPFTGMKDMKILRNRWVMVPGLRMQIWIWMTMRLHLVPVATLCHRHSSQRVIHREDTPPHSHLAFLLLPLLLHHRLFLRKKTLHRC